jgi:hypothetical protein
MDIKDLAGLSQPLTKLIEVLSSGMGAIYRPIGIRREAEAHADATRLLGAAQLEVDVTRAHAIAVTDASNKLVLAEANVQIEERAQARLQYREVRRQENLEAIAEAAVSHLPEQVSSTTVDEDWKTRFFNIAEDVSNTEMQDLWGKILAGEVARPGTYSVRTLENLRNLSQCEAEAFQKLRYLALDVGHVLKVGGETHFKEFGLTFNDILSLREAGILADGDMLSLELTFTDDKPFFVLAYNGKGLLIETPNVEMKTLTLDSLVLTEVGRQLLSLIEPQPNTEYLRKMAAANKDKAKFYFGAPGSPRETFEKFSPD